MASVKISQLTSAASVSGTQEFEINDSGTSKKVTGSQIKTFVKDALAPSDIVGVTASVAEINKLTGATLTTAELNKLTGLTATTAELNKLAGVTATTAEINKLAGVTATTAEINKLAGTPAGLTATELGYVDGVTSSIQTQIDAKLASAADANITGGYTTTADDDGTFSSGTYTPTPSGGNMKRILNAGAFTFAAPTAAGDYTIIVQMTNATGAGTVTFSGFTRAAGSTTTTTVGHDFFYTIVKLNGFTYLNAVALQ